MHKLCTRRLTNFFKNNFRYPTQKQPRRLSEDIARSFSEQRRAYTPRQPVEHTQGESSGNYMQDRADMLRKKAPQLIDEDLDALSDESEKVVAPRMDKRKAKKPQKEPPTEEEYYEALSSMAFTGTRYPHPETMRALGISRDVGYLFGECHLSTLMREPFAGYKEETCQFLASLNVNFYDTEQEALDDGQRAEEVGFITFEVNQHGYLLHISRIDTLFDFPTGPGTNQDIDKEELQDLWRFIASGGAYSSARSKSAQIRNPAIRYVHKSLAGTLFARKVTGNVNEGELRMLDLALKSLMDHSGHTRAFEGDRAGTGITMVLLDQMLGYREWAERLYRGGKRSELTVGGIVTPILRAAGVELVTQPYEPKWLDIANLKKQHLLEQKSVNQGHLYKFTHPVIGEANVILPNTMLTKIRLGRNIDFLPPADALYNPRREPIREDPVEPEREYEEAPSEYVVEDETESGRYTFEDDPPARTIKEANRRIGLLQKWNKWQDKTVRALKNSVRDLTDSVKEMATQLKELKGKKSKSPTKSPLRRSGSFSFRPSQRTSVDPPRRSAVETQRSGEPSLQYQRKKKRRAVPADQGEHSVRSLGQQTEFNLRRSDSMDPSRVHQPESATPYATASTSVPDYTQDSMDAYTASFFTAP